MEKVKPIYTLSPDSKNGNNEGVDEIKTKENSGNQIPSNYNPFLQQSIECIPEEEIKNDQTNSTNIPPPYVKTKKPIVNSPNLMLNKKKANHNTNSKFPILTKASTFNEKDIKKITENRDEDNLPCFGTGDDEDIHNKVTSVGVNIKKNKK